MKEWNLSLWVGVLFVIIGIVTAVAEEFLAAVSSIALGVSLLLLDPPMTLGRSERVVDKSDDSRQIWGLKLTPRNIVALVFLAVSVVTFLAVISGDFSK